MTTPNNRAPASAPRPRWPREREFDAVIEAAGKRHGVAPALLKAVIAQESGFNPRAWRAEPQLGEGEGSRGLMQILFRTGRIFDPRLTPEGLYDPARNVDIGARYLADLLRQAARNGYGIDSALSSYNAGPSPVRAGDGKRVTVQRATPAEASRFKFVNQASYVDPVIRHLRYFMAQGYGTASPAYDAGRRSSAVGFVLGVAVLAVGALALQRGA